MSPAHWSALLVNVSGQRNLVGGGRMGQWRPWALYRPLRHEVLLFVLLALPPGPGCGDRDGGAPFASRREQLCLEVEGVTMGLSLLPFIELLFQVAWGGLRLYAAMKEPLPFPVWISGATRCGPVLGGGCPGSSCTWNDERRVPRSHLR